MNLTYGAAEEYCIIKCLKVCIVICGNVVHCAAKWTVREKTIDEDCQHRRSPLKIIRIILAHELLLGVCHSSVWRIRHEQDNPHGTKSHAVQRRFTENVWAGIIGDSWDLTNYRPDWTARKHLIFLEIVLPTFLGTVPEHIRQDIWFQRDKAPAYSTIVVRDFMSRTFEAR
ncbi:hypothetical protein TNCV_853461 [Trichonephila clavipes]|nr:hypothetical protein TNCV_853461 [Trichonephila clavipes]